MFAMPAFWIGLLLANEFSLRLHWFPVSGYEGGPRGILRSLTLPAITIALFLGPILLRTLRASLVEVMGAEFIEAARARGFGESRVISRHAMRNALISTITVIGANVGFLISGTVIVEEVYGLPGLGSLLVGSILHRDYLLVQTMVLLFGFVVIFANLLTDLAYALVDPRVRLGARVT
jgi:peptide/nickel transport system permease protein